MEEIGWERVSESSKHTTGTMNTRMDRQHWKKPYRLVPVRLAAILSSHRRPSCRSLSIVCFFCFYHLSRLACVRKRNNSSTDDTRSFNKTSFLPPFLRLRHLASRPSFHFFFFPFFLFFFSNGRDLSGYSNRRARGEIIHHSSIPTTFERSCN